MWKSRAPALREAGSYCMGRRLVIGGFLLIGNQSAINTQQLTHTDIYKICSVFTDSSDSHTYQADCPLATRRIYIAIIEPSCLGEAMILFYRVL